MKTLLRANIVFFYRLQLCLIDIVNDFFNRVMQINKNDKNCIIYRDALEIKKTSIEKVSLKDCLIKNEMLYKSDNL